MIRWILALALLAAPAQAELVGHTYAEVIKGTEFDPALHGTTAATREAFIDTLNGPQTPGIIVRLGGREFLVYEACTAHLCAFYHSVTVIDTQSGAFYAAVYGDGGKSIIVPEPSIETLVGTACDANVCDFKTVVATGAQITPEPLLLEDFKGFPGGANCRSFDESGNVVLYTEGRGVMRFHGERVSLVEDGIGGDALYSTGHKTPIVVTFADRPGKAISDHEVSIRPRTITILSNNQTVTFPVTVKCES